MNNLCLLIYAVEQQHSSSMIFMAEKADQKILICNPVKTWEAASRPQNVWKNLSSFLKLI